MSTSTATPLGPPMPDPELDGSSVSPSSEREDSSKLRARLAERDREEEIQQARPRKRLCRLIPLAVPATASDDRVGPPQDIDADRRPRQPVMHTWRREVSGEEHDEAADEEGRHKLIEDDVRHLRDGLRAEPQVHSDAKSQQTREREDTREGLPLDPLREAVILKVWCSLTQ